MNLNFPDLSPRQPGSPSEQTQLETGSGAMFISHNGAKQPVTLTSEESVISLGAAPAESENKKSSLIKRDAAILVEDSTKAQKTLIMDPAANDGNSSLQLAEADPLQGINREDPDSAFRHLCIEDDGTKLSYLLAEMDEETRHNWLNSPLNYSEKSDTPIIYAARHGHTSVVSSLIYHGADPLAENPHSEKKFPALIVAAQENHAKVIEEMAKWGGFEPDKPLGNGLTAMYIAIGNSAVEAVEALLKCHADPNCAVHFCVREDENKVVPGRSLVQQDGTLLPTILVTPVYFAAERGDVKILKMLLENGGSTSNPDPGNLAQFSPLAKALMGSKRCPEAVALLLKHGADMYEKIPVSSKLQKTERQLRYRPSLLEMICQHTLVDESNPFLQVFYDHFCMTYGSRSSYDDFLRYFFFMFLVKAVYSSEEMIENPVDSSIYHSLRKNYSAVEAAKSGLRSDECQLSEEHRSLLFTFCECSGVILKKLLKKPVTSAELENAVHAWLVRVEAMGINKILLCPEITELFRQNVGIWSSGIYFFHSLAGS